MRYALLLCAIALHAQTTLELAKPVEDHLKFWQDVAHEGTPLSEPVEKEPNYLLVTFLWRETFETYNVLVGWFPYAAEHPDDFQMARLAGTDLWHKTVKIRKGARFTY